MEDKFAFIVELCQPTDSQEEKFRSWPFVRENECENTASSSPDPTPSEHTPIVMVSVSDSESDGDRDGQRGDGRGRGSGRESSVEQSTPPDNSEFHTPPEHHLLSSSEEQHVDGDAGAAAVQANGGVGVERKGELGNGASEKTIRVLEKVPENGPATKKIRVNEELNPEIEGDTLSAGETELIGSEIRLSQNGNGTEVIDLGSDQETGEAVNLNEDSPDKKWEQGLEVGEIKQKGRDGVLQDEDGDETIPPSTDEESPMKEYDRSSQVGRDGEVHKSGEHEGQDCRDGVIIRINGNDGSKEMRKNKKVNEVNGGEEVCENGEEGGISNVKIVEEIERCDHGSGNGVEGRVKERTGDHAGKRELPPSLKGKDKNIGADDAVENVGGNNELKNFLDVLQLVARDVDGNSEDVDFLETAKSRGMTFPQPRWWSPEDSDF